MLPNFHLSSAVSSQLDPSILDDHYPNLTLWISSEHYPYHIFLNLRGKWTFIGKFYYDDKEIIESDNVPKHDHHPRNTDCDGKSTSDEDGSCIQHSESS